MLHMRVVVECGWCARCRSSFKRSPVGPLVEWLRSPCSAIGTDVDRPVPLPYEVCHIGNQTVCYSHSLRVLRGLLFCAKCGAISQGGKLGKLGRDCAPPGPYGLRNKRYLIQGRLPLGYLSGPIVVQMEGSQEASYQVSHPLIRFEV